MGPDVGLQVHRLTQHVSLCTWSSPVLSQLEWPGTSPSLVALVAPSKVRVALAWTELYDFKWIVKALSPMFASSRGRTYTARLDFRQTRSSSLVVHHKGRRTET